MTSLTPAIPVTTKRISSEDLGLLRRIVARFSSTSVPQAWIVADFITQALSALARRAMLSVGVRRELVSFVAERAHHDGTELASIVDAVDSLLGELAAYGISDEESATLSMFCSSGALDNLLSLRRAVFVALMARIAGERLANKDRAELARYVESECDSVALAVASLLRACDAAEVEDVQHRQRTLPDWRI